MKRVFLLSLFFMATPAFAQVISVDEIPSITLPTEATTTVVVVETVPVLPAPTAVVATTTDIATTTEPTPVATTTELTDSVTIVPGLSLKISSTVPATNTPTTNSDEGIFGLIYTGFEEFVFKVFGI